MFQPCNYTTHIIHIWSPRPLTAQQPAPDPMGFYWILAPKCGDARAGNFSTKLGMNPSSKSLWLGTWNGEWRIRQSCITMALPYLWSFPRNKFDKGYNSIPNSEHTLFQRSRSAGCLAKSHLPRLFLKLSPNVRVWRAPGKVKPCKLWLNQKPNDRVRRLFGNVRPAKLWLNRSPNVKVCRLLGKLTPANLWLNLSPKVRVWGLPGNARPAKLWLNSCTKV